MEATEDQGVMGLGTNQIPPRPDGMCTILHRAFIFRSAAGCSSATHKRNADGYTRAIDLS